MGRGARWFATGAVALSSAFCPAAVAAADPVEPLAVPRVKAVDPSSIWNFKLVADSSVPVKITAVRVDSGDLVFGLASSYPDQCSGTTLLPSDTTGCSLSFMRGSRGILQVSMDGALDQYVGVGSPVPSLPTEATAPPQPAEADTSPLFEVDELSSWQDGRVAIVNRNATFTVDTVEIVPGGDLAWASPADADACRGIELAPDAAACTLQLRGTSGTVRLWGGLWSTDLEIDLTQLRPVPAVVPEPATDPYLQARSSSSSMVTIENVGAEPAEITSVEVVNGWLAWDDETTLPDSCTGATVSGKADACALQMDGTGVVRFHLAGGASQDVGVNAGEFSDPWDTWPSARLWQRSRRAAPTPSDPSAFTYDYTYAPPATPITGILRFGATGESQARLDSIEASVDGIPLGTYSGSSDINCSGTNACIDTCETALVADPTGVCSSWFWGLSSDQVGSKTQNVPFTLDTARLPNGRHTITVAVTGTPQAQRTSYQSWQIVTQNPQPVVSLSGGLYGGPAVPIANGSLSVNTDSTPGVAAMRLIEVTGRTTTLLDSITRTCGGVCSPLPWAGMLSVDPIARGWRDGPHWLRLATTSATGVVATVDWTIDFYRAAWLYGGLDDAADFARLENDLYTRSDAAQIWAMLRQAERARVLRGTAGYLVRERSEAGVFAFVSGPERHRVTDASAFGLTQASVRVLPDGALGSIPWGTDIRADLKLYREGNDPAVFYLYGGVRYWITSPAVAAAFALDLSTVVSVPPGFFRWVPRGQDVGMSGIPGILIPQPAPTTTPPPRQQQAFVIGNESWQQTYRFTPTPAAGLHLAVIENDTRVVWVNTANQIVSSLATSSAIDDIGRAIRMTYRLDGTTVLIDVFHRGSGARYPVIVDTDSSYWDPAQAARIDRELAMLPGPDGRPVAGGAGAYEDLKEMTPAEISFCAIRVPLCRLFQGDRSKVFKMAGHLFDGQNDPYRKNAFVHSYWTGLMMHSAWAVNHVPGMIELGYEYARRHESEAQQSPDPNTRALSNMDLHNNRQAWLWSKATATNATKPNYTRNETAVCNAMRHKADDAVWVSRASSTTTWPGSRLVYFNRGTTRRAGTSC
jgi:hypothetical protein